MSIKPEIRIAGDGQAWAHEAATFLRSICDHAIRARGRMLIALSGGSTPRTLYRTLAQPEWKRRCEWPRLHFLFGDERCVPPDHPESNFGMADRELFQPIGIPPAQISRMKGELPEPMEAAWQYEDTLRSLTDCRPPDMPEIDLILLGLGEDGHTASLFPGTEALNDRSHLVTVGRAPAGIALRLTLTLGVINRASVVLFLVTGSGKASMVRRVVEPQSEADRALPAARVSPASGRLIWMLDQSAAAQLRTA
ncbi:6-phosphogluconolactonase [Nitrospira moscoviensis]|uniref:6-phosphogluconolactonase n=1 Tax=Nitrospira moscoviensis TaxID=42253 RepID=A0A0K2G6Y4_NITMO|nr:6-phosphogluconolactonase [Nitrospira moscoviensis]ALA56713.1 6-phosphogluconolactonase [Nitrospira moscoviensis]